MFSSTKSSIPGLPRAAPGALPPSGRSRPLVQAYLSADKRGDGVWSEAEALLATLRQQDLRPEEVAALSQ